MKERLERRHKNVAMSDFHPPASPYRTKAGSDILSNLQKS